MTVTPSTLSGVWEPPLPEARGPVSAALLEALAGPPGAVPQPGSMAGDPLSDDDLHLALYMCYELHYKSFSGVDPFWEWNPSLLELRGRLEARFEAAVVGLYYEPEWRAGVADVREALLELADRPGPSLSRYLKEQATLPQFREFLINKSAYRLKEADPQCWTIPRLEGKAKAALVEVEYDEYGSGRADRIHSLLFRRTMEALGLDGRYGYYLDRVPGVMLATVNLLSLFGLHRRWRAASAGALAIAEMTSSRANKLAGDGARRLGFGPEATDFFDEHVLADSVHDMVSLHYMAAGLAEHDPSLAGDILFGAAAGEGMDGRFRQQVIDCWERGETSLYRPS